MTEFIATFESTPLGAIFSFLFGLIFGSFFNACIYRLPREMTMVTRSKCTQCRKQLTWSMNIPLVSFVIQKGKCAYCGKKISWEYPLVELTTGLLFLWLYLRLGISKEFAAGLVFFSLLWVISVIDIHHQIIPDELSLSGIPIGFLFALWLGDPTWSESLLGILIGGGVFFAVAYFYEYFTKREGLGGGDIKLLGMIGAWLGYRSILPVIVISSFLGSIVGIGVMIFQKKDFKAAIPFGPFLALAAAAYWLWKPQILNLFSFVPE